MKKGKEIINEVKPTMGHDVSMQAAHDDPVERCLMNDNCRINDVRRSPDECQVRRRSRSMQCKESQTKEIRLLDDLIAERCRRRMMTGRFPR